MVYQVSNTLENALSLPARQYTSQSGFESEVELLFRKKWFPVACIDLLSNPGDYLVHDHFVDEISVVRSESGKLNVFSNICLHRACPILKGEGNVAGKCLFCPYNKWVYQLDGQLRGAPLMEQADGFIASSHQLQSVALEIW
ncbi:MAG: choline monooxygenase [Candidatus Azotimanducaceae bacterium]